VPAVAPPTPTCVALGPPAPPVARPASTRAATGVTPATTFLDLAAVDGATAPPADAPAAAPPAAHERILRRAVRTTRSPVRAGGGRGHRRRPVRAAGVVAAAVLLAAPLVVAHVALGAGGRSGSAAERAELVDGPGPTAAPDAAAAAAVATGAP
jgi:hypothetical protein